MRNQERIRIPMVCVIGLAALVLAIGVTALPTLADDAVKEAAPTPETVPPNYAALHDRSSPSYDANCLGCHQSILSESSTNPRIPGIHPKMLPYTPGYSPRRGATNETCQKCHFTVDFYGTTAGGLRKQVGARECALCHSPAGPGKPLYKR